MWTVAGDGSGGRTWGTTVFGEGVLTNLRGTSGSVDVVGGSVRFKESKEGLRRSGRISFPGSSPVRRRGGGCPCVSRQIRGLTGTGGPDAEVPSTDLALPPHLGSFYWVVGGSPWTVHRGSGGWGPALKDSDLQIRCSGVLDSSPTPYQLKRKKTDVPWGGGGVQSRIEEVGTSVTLFFPLVVGGTDGTKGGEVSRGPRSSVTRPRSGVNRVVS